MTTKPPREVFVVEVNGEPEDTYVIEYDAAASANVHPQGRVVRYVPSEDVGRLVAVASKVLANIEDDYNYEDKELRAALAPFTKPR